MEDDTQWVHERDYGSLDLGGLFVGLGEVIVGLVQFIFYIFDKGEE